VPPSAIAPPAMMKNDERAQPHVTPAGGSAADVGQLRANLREAAHEVGFFYLTGHGVPDTLARAVLEAARRLFELPQADKDAIAMVRSPHFRGYTRLGGELTRGQVDWREQIDIGPNARRSADPTSRTISGCRAPTSGRPRCRSCRRHRRVGSGVVLGSPHPAPTLGGRAGQPTRRLRLSICRDARHAD